MYYPYANQTIFIHAVMTSAVSIPLIYKAACTSAYDYNHVVREGTNILIINDFCVGKSFHNKQYYAD